MTRWTAENLQALREKRRADPEPNRAVVRAWGAANREAKRVANAEWRAANGARMKELRAAWKKANPDRIRVYKSARRAASGESMSVDIVSRLLVLQRHRCANCATDLRVSGIHLDHRFPLALGGANGDENAQLLCPSCNYRKGALDPVEFAQRQGRLL